ncbi:hypothetical protein PG994_005115 [Apiospora phragmitis]|uniref:AtuA-like ferredoxin-fold domain-containing protein n=1 Tax=Apiospora phragmitis TaxID=2905665 RepID=A0ABR1VSI8_9PEZI
MTMALAERDHISFIFLADSYNTHEICGGTADHMLRGSNCNVGLFVRDEYEWPWLRSLLTTEKFVELMGDEYAGQKIDRMEFPNLWAVHFLVKDFLDRGVTANATYDVLGKFLAEFVRCRTVEMPVEFLKRGRI